MVKVYFLDMQKLGKEKTLAKLPELFDLAGFGSFIEKGDSVALKIHFGEIGNTAYLKPLWVKPIIEKVKEKGGRPFLTDANTLYQGTRNETISHLKTASEHGYDLVSTGAPVIIADGLTGKDTAHVKIDLKHFKELKIALAIQQAQSLIALTHFKGHDMTGFGGALKNIGMGSGTKAGKLDMHSDCENCKARTTCQKKQTIEACWVGSSDLVQEKMVEYAYGVIKERPYKVGFLTFILDVSPNCDCYSFNDPPIVEDIGILASLDPIAIDQASVDLVGGDNFKKLYPNVDWAIQLKYGEKIGLGSRKYELIPAF